MGCDAMELGFLRVCIPPGEGQAGESSTMLHGAQISIKQPPSFLRGLFGLILANSDADYIPTETYEMDATGGSTENR